MGEKNARLRFHDRRSSVSCILEAQIKSQSRPKLTLCLTITLTHTCIYTLKYLGNNCRVTHGFTYISLILRLCLVA